MNTNPAGYTYSDYLAHKDDELYHFGIKGMKWGIRRFQRKDGSLTPAGRKHIKTNPSYDSDKEARKAKIKKAAKITAGVAATAALAYGGYRLYKSGKGKELISRIKGPNGPKPILGLPQKKKMELSIPRKPIEPKRRKGRTAKEALDYLKKKHEADGLRRGNPTKEAFERATKSNQHNDEWSRASKMFDEQMKSKTAWTEAANRAKAQSQQLDKSLDGFAERINNLNKKTGRAPKPESATEILKRKKREARWNRERGNRMSWENADFANRMREEFYGDPHRRYDRW